jgi:hypothetical protein
MSPLSMQRTAKHGGDLEGRGRFLVEVVEAVRTGWPENGRCSSGDTVMLARVLLRHPLAGTALGRDVAVVGRGGCARVGSRRALTVLAGCTAAVDAPHLYRDTGRARRSGRGDPEPGRGPGSGCGRRLHQALQHHRRPTPAPRWRQPRGRSTPAADGTAPPGS